MDLTKYRESDSEKIRTEDLMRLITGRGNTALDIGARDGHFSKLLTEKYKNVIALDLEKPTMHHPNIMCVQGDVTNLGFFDNSNDLVFCAEVLEHIPVPLLYKACSEISRVSKEYLLIGVPYKQDIRVGRTTCYTCGKKNPPWGHVNSFDENRLAKLFPKFNICEVSFIGKSVTHTNIVSSALMDFAGNPYGTYNQEEPCIHCNNRMLPPPFERSFLQKVSTRLAFYINNIQKPFLREHGNWIHILFKKIVL
ncbi:class I SAM-dependent methyltransferase [Colwellia psychrerythraea]|nr:class I SAM-dependent methyltransferase [Colwellia psychrerythraea]